MQNDKFLSHFFITIPYRTPSFNGFLQKYENVFSVKIVQNRGSWFVESSGFMDLAYKPAFLSRLFIDILLKNCILISDVRFHVKMQTHTHII